MLFFKELTKTFKSELESQLKKLNKNDLSQIKIDKKKLYLSKYLKKSIDLKFKNFNNIITRNNFRYDL